MGSGRRHDSEAESDGAPTRNDAELSQFDFGGYEENTIEMRDLSEEDRKTASAVGYGLDADSSVAGTYMQIDNEGFLAEVLGQPRGLEVMTLNEAVSRHSWLKNYLWNAVSSSTDSYTQASKRARYNGYFIRASAGAKIDLPVQSCLMIKRGGIAQNVHNIVIAEEGSELHVITGCTTPGVSEPSLHIGISEFYVKRNAKLSFTMIHRWSDQVDVRPRSAIVVEENGTYVSNYVILSAAKSIQTSPRVILGGKHAHADLYSVIYGSGRSSYDIGGALVLRGTGSNGRIISRAIATEHADIVARGEIVGETDGVKARLECNGLIVSDTARIRAIPILEALAQGVELSHEATVGRIGADQLNYLMSRGLTEDEATSLVIGGFIRLTSPGLPRSIQQYIDDAIRMTIEKSV
ncbi:MAG: SufD family Fe-S cluster assembly protein [Candidatus Thorarchaeota archaeon]